MAILAGLLGFVGRFAGKVLTTTLGWASTLLFGRVPGDRQIVLALITFGSVVWAALTIGVVLPYVGAFLVAAVPAPGIVSEDMLRLGMLIGALVVPAVVGVASIFVVEPAKRPKGVGLVAQVLRGYPLSAALAVTLVLLALVGIARFIHHLALRWADAHVAVVIRPGGYERVVADLPPRIGRRARCPLARPGEARPARGRGTRGRTIPVGHRDLGRQDEGCAGQGGDRLSAARDRRLDDDLRRGPGDREPTGAPCRPADGRWDPGAAAASDGASAADDVEAELRSIDEALAVLAVPHDEWEVLYRQRLQVERDLLAGSRPGASFPGGGASTLAPDRNGRRREGDRLPDWLPAAIAACGFVLTAADIALALAERRRRN